MSLENFFNGILRHKFIIGGILLSALPFLSPFLKFDSMRACVYSVMAILLYAVSVCIYQRSVNHELVIAREEQILQNFLFQGVNRFLEDKDQAQGFYLNLIDDQVLSILDELNFRYDPSIRISLYNHSQNAFTLLYRYSDDPEFKKKGRAVYSDSEGVIGEAYHKNGCVIDHLPDPKVNEEEWVNAHLDPARGRMNNLENIKNLTMRSRNLIALPIRDGDRKHVIVVLESLSPGRLDKKKIEKALSVRGKHLQRVLSMFRACLEPAIGYAEKMRF